MSDTDDTGTELVVVKKHRKTTPSGFKKGVSGNPNGRPKSGDSLASQLRKTGAESVLITLDDGSQKKMSRFERLVEVLWEQVLVQHDKQMIKFVFERVDGLPTVHEPEKDEPGTYDIELAKFRLRATLFDEQQQLMNTRKKMSMLLCGRRSGKTYAIAAKMTELAITHNSGTILYVTKTVSQAYKNIWKYLVEFAALSRMPHKSNSSDYSITFDAGTKIILSGSDTIDQVDKLRGQAYLAAFVDEIQSIKYAKLLVDEVIRPATKDFTDPLIVLAGTAPRAANTPWENWWLNADMNTQKLHWTMEQNVFIPSYETVLQDVLAEEGLTIDHPRFQREYLGVFMYDTEARVYLIDDKNYFSWGEFDSWCVPPPGWNIIRPKVPFGVKDPDDEDHNVWNDIRFTGGLDYGFSDSDAFVITAFSISKPERYILYQYKQNHTGVGDVAAAVRRGIEELASKNELFKRAVENDDFKIYCDYAGAGSKITFDLRNSYRLPVVNAIKQDKDGAIDMLQEDIRTGRLKLEKNSPFDEESKSVVWERDENDVIHRIVDDDAYHPDVADAVLYSLRPCWQYFNEGKGT